MKTVNVMITGTGQTQAKKKSKLNGNLAQRGRGGQVDPNVSKSYGSSRAGSSGLNGKGRLGSFLVKGRLKRRGWVGLPSFRFF